MVEDLCLHFSRPGGEPGRRYPTDRAAAWWRYSCSLEPEDASSDTPVIMGLRALHLLADSTLT